MLETYISVSMIRGKDEAKQIPSVALRAGLQDAQPFSRSQYTPVIRRSELTELKRFSLVKPTIQTSFHIDFDWWAQNERDWRVDLRGFLCPLHQKSYEGMLGDNMVDWIDPVTAEVKQVDGLQNVLIQHCAKQEGFITRQTTLVDAVFRIFLANSNTPLSPFELGEHLGRQPQVILTTLAGGHIYKGLRPFLGIPEQSSPPLSQNANK